MASAPPLTQCADRGPSWGPRAKHLCALVCAWTLFELGARELPQPGWPGPRGAGVAFASMRARRFALYVAGATVGVGLAYVLGILPHAPLPAAEPAKTVPKKAEGKGRGGPPAPVTAASVIVSDMPVILVAPGTVEPFANVAVKTRVDGQIVEVLFKEGDLVNENEV